MVRSGCVFFAVVLAAAISPAAAGGEAARVGAYGEPSRLAIEGAQSYKPDGIVSALAADLDVAYASCADRPLAELKALLADKVREAYLRDGFADVHVSIRQEPSRLVLAIAEGRRFLAGEVRVSGAQSIDVQLLIDGLTEKRRTKSLENEITEIRDGRPKKASGLWSVGEHALLGELARVALRGQVESLLRDQGYFGGRFSLSPQIDRQRGTASLEIVFADEGVRHVARNLAITGGERNSRDAVLNYVGLFDDTVLTAETRSQIEKTLDDSGRFTKVRWHYASAMPPIPPRLELSEYVAAPPLDQPLSREEETLLNFYRWTQHFNGGADEIAIDVEVGKARCGAISAPHSGFVGWIGGLPGARPPLADGQVAMDLAFVSTNAEIGLYSYRRGRKLACALTPTPVMLLLGSTLACGPPKLNGTGQFTAGVGASSAANEKKRHCEFRFNQSAVGAVSLAHQNDVKFHWQGDVLTVERKDFQLVIDAPTGRLLKHAAITEGAALQAVRMRIGCNEFEPTLRQIRSRADRFENFASPRFPLSCLAAYACDEATYWASAANVRRIADFANVIRKLVDKGLLTPIDRAVIAPKSLEPRFRLAIPSTDVNSKTDLPGAIEVSMRAYGIEHGDRLAPRGSWPWLMAREAMFVAAGKRDRLAQALDDLKSDASGPIRCLAASLLLDAAGYEIESRDVARAGRNNTSLTQFRNDYRALLARGYYAGEAIARLTEVLRELDEPESRALAEGMVELRLLDQRGGDLLVDAMRRLRSRPDEPIDRLLPNVLDDLWAAGLRDCLEETLESAATIPPAHGSAEWALKQLQELGDLKRRLKQLDLPPDESKRRLKELEELERLYRVIKASDAN